MAPTRGLRRVIVAIAVTIIASHFFVRQPSESSESKPKPAPVRTPTVRAQPVQNTTQPKRRKVAVFYNVYARPRPHNRTCTSSTTWHKAGEPDKNCAWIGSSHNKQVTARRCRTASRIAAEVCGCECANVTTDLAVGIVDEQLKRLRNRPLWSFISRIHVATIGSQAAVTAVMERCAKLGRKCVHIGHARTGDETRSLTPLHEYCAAHPKAAVAYLHNKGSFSDRPANAHLRRVLLRGLSSKPCADAIASGSDCDVCSMRFSPVPHQHVSGNMWLARGAVRKSSPTAR